MPACHHLAVIMDGNGRYAKNLGKSRTEGHRQGALAVRRVIEACQELGVKNLTLFCFSTENWTRPSGEVEFLFRLLDEYITNECENLHKNGIKLRVIGDLTPISANLQKKIQWAEDLTKDGAFCLQLAINYGARAEITHAMRNLGQQLLQQKLTINDITEERIARELACFDIGDPDLLVRTSGEQRISNFLLWQISYSELLFEPKNWPEITRDDVKNWVEEFEKRQRRYGGL